MTSKPTEFEIAENNLHRASAAVAELHNGGVPLDHPRMVATLGEQELCADALRRVASRLGIEVKVRTFTPGDSSE